MGNMVALVVLVAIQMVINWDRQRKGDEVMKRVLSTLEELPKNLPKPPRPPAPPRYPDPQPLPDLVGIVEALGRAISATVNPASPQTDVGVIRGPGMKDIGFTDDTGMADRHWFPDVELEDVMMNGNEVFPTHGGWVASTPGTNTTPQPSPLPDPNFAPDGSPRFKAGNGIDAATLQGGVE